MSTSLSSVMAAPVAVAGEALIDLLARPDGLMQPCLGGAVYNLSRALSRQGVPTSYLNPLSEDRFGRSLARQLVADGVRLAQANPVRAVTSLAVVQLDEHGHPDYAFYREGVADRQVQADTLARHCAALPSLACVCTGGLALDPRDAAVYLPWLAGQRAAGRAVVVDANLRPSVMPDVSAYRDHVQRVLAQAHLIKVSDEDLAHLQLPGHSPLAQAETLLAQTQAAWLALTLGPRGAWLLARDGRRWSACEPSVLAVVDTVGAGDSFLAGLLASGMRVAPGWAMQPQALSNAAAGHALQQAVACASLCVQRSGCVPPSWDEARHWAQTHPSLQSQP